MKSKKDQQIDHEFMEALYKKVSIEYIKRESDKIDKDNSDIPHISFSEDFNKKMNCLISKNKRQKRLLTINRYVAGLAAAFLLYSTLNPQIATAYKSKFVNMIKEYTNVYVKTTTFVSNVEYPTEDFPMDWDAVYAPSKLPSGYTVDSINVMEPDYFSIIFKKNEDTLIFKCFVSSSTVRFADNEYYKNKEIKINGEDALYTYKDNNGILYWSNGDYDFSINGYNLTESDYIEIANGLIQIK